MAIEYKYGRVTTESGNIPDDEPVVVFRAKDKLLPFVLSFYASLSKENGSPQPHLDRVKSTHAKIMEWQDQNLDKVKVPD